VTTLTLNTEALRSTAIDEYRLLEISQPFSLVRLEYGISKTLVFDEISTLCLATEGTTVFSVYVTTGELDLHLGDDDTATPVFRVTAPGAFSIINSPVGGITLKGVDTTSTYTYLLGE